MAEKFPLTSVAESKGVAKTAKTEFKVRRVLRGHFGKVYACSWAQDSKYMVSASQDGKLLIWNVMTGMKNHAISLRSSWVMATDFAPSMKMVAAGGLDNTCSIYDVSLNVSDAVQREATPVELVGHEGYVSSCTFMDDRKILTTSGDASAILWDIDKLASTHKFSEHKADVMTASVSKDKNLFLTGSCDATVRLWDVRTDASVKTFSGHESDVNSVKWFSNGYTFVTGSDDSRCMLYDIRTESELNVYHSDRILCGVTSVDCSASGKYVFAAYDEGIVRVWNTLYGQLTQELSTEGSRVSSVKVSPDGQALVIASWDNLLRVWA